MYNINLRSPSPEVCRIYKNNFKIEIKFGILFNVVQINFLILLKSSLPKIDNLSWSYSKVKTFLYLSRRILHI